MNLAPTLEEWENCCAEMKNMKLGQSSVAEETREGLGGVNSYVMEV